MGNYGRWKICITSFGSGTGSGTEAAHRITAFSRNACRRIGDQNNSGGTRSLPPQKSPEFECELRHADGSSPSYNYFERH